MSAATNSERVKASRLRAKAEREMLTGREAQWLRSYTARHPPRNPPRAPAPPPKQTPPPRVVAAPDPPAKPAETDTYVAPQASELDEGHALPDLRELDAQPPAQPPGNAARTDVADVLDDATPDPLFGSNPDGGCGACSTCRGEAREKAPRCAKSGDVIPRPLSSRDAKSMAAMSLGAVALAVCAFEKVTIAHGPRDEVLADAAASWQALSERYDMSTVNELLPWIGLVRSHGTQFQEVKKEAQQIKAEKKSTNGLGPAPTGG